MQSAIVRTAKLLIMPLNLPDKLPAIEALKKENIFVMNESRAAHQDIRPLKIIILNLMPLKVTTETDLIRLLSNTPLQVVVDFLQIKGHKPKNTPIEHMKAFYRDFETVKHKKYDGMIITGAPVEHLPFEKVDYWEEIKTIFDWSLTNVTSSLHICWGAQAGLYHFYNIPKYPLPEKKFGVFKHTLNEPKLPIFRGFDDFFFSPHSRYTEIRAEDIKKHKELEIISMSDDAGVHLVMGNNGRQFYITGHMEYSPNTLGQEYKRDVKKGLDIKIPKNYFSNDNPDLEPVVRWKSHANLLFSNWLNYYVYQETPYDID